ncbi:sodium-dependent transporter [Parvularcula oceani]|uniref:sodium-dependent transporter n=1 Tax=Parvularcula oceani TaxID=1247963 RepID=UPI00056213DF|nr:sodium-dependent transporter [Parvularcula oceani]
MENLKVHETWSSRPAFLLSAIGFAVGLGNIWRFPYVAGENGGGAFVLIYLVVLFCIGAPLVAAELLIGRRGDLSPIGSMQRLAREAGASSAWGGVGVLALVATFLILTFYSVVAGWAADYLWRSVFGGFAGIDAAQSRERFDTLLATPWRLALWQAVMLGLAVMIIRRGVSKGIEKAALVLMPMLFLILIVMALYGMTLEGFGDAAAFLFVPDFSRVTAQTFLIAIGQAFFSVGVAMGGMITYGAYMPDRIKIPSSTIIIASADTLVALVAGLAIFPIVFTSGLAPAEGTGLVFQSLPLAFGNMAYGGVIAVAFFLLLVAAALTSMVANLEPLVSWAEEHGGMKRPGAALAFGLAIFGVGIASTLSFNVLSDFHPLGVLPIFEEMTIYGATEFIASNLLLPIGALLTAVFVGWIVKREAAQDELELSGGALFGTWLFLLRFVAPLGILLLIVFAFIG